MEAVWKKQYSLAELVASDQFKSYDELKKRLDYVLGTKGSSRMQSVSEEEEYESYVQTPSKETRVMEELEESYARSKTPAPSLPKISSNDSDDDEDDALSYFQRLVDE